MALFRRQAPQNTGEVAPELHVYPRSDILNSPAEVQAMAAFSVWDTAIMSSWLRTVPNVRADGHGDDSPWGRNDRNLAYPLAAAYTAPFVIDPNTASVAQQQPVQASVLARRTNRLLAMVQEHLIGAP